MSVADSQRPNHVLVTGGSGAFGHRVIDELLKAGYKVRATCRPSKVDVFKAIFPPAGDRLEVTEMDDLITADWEKPLKGIDAVIHVASPVFGQGTTNQQIYDGAVLGTKRLLEAVGQSSTMKRFVLTGSVGAFCKLDLSDVFEDVTYDENTFGAVEDGHQLDAESLPPTAMYTASKCIADKLVWKAAKEYPQIDFTTIFPGSIYGKFLDGYPINSAESFNVNRFLYDLLRPGVPFPPFPMTAQSHSADLARAHVLALTAPRLTDGRKKRLIVCQDYIHWEEVVKHLREKRPQLKGRLPSDEKMKEGLERPGAQARFKLDTKMTEEVLGLKYEDYKPWRETVLEVIDWVLEWEKGAAAAM